MINLRLSSIDAHPKEIFKALADKKAELEWFDKLDKGKLIELKKVKVLKNNTGWYNLVATALRELRP